MPFSPEAAAFTGSATVVVVNIIGWVIANNRNRVAVGEAALAAAKAATKEFTRIEETVNKLPCVRDGDYMKDNGRLMEKVDNLGRQVERAEAKMDKVLLHLDKNGSE